MAESTLILGYDDFRSEIGLDVGWGSDSAEWDADKAASIDSAVQDGLRQAYNPPVLPGEIDAYFWRFLKPIDTITVWPTTTGAVSGLPVYDSGSDQSTITATAAKFYPSMVGKSFTFDASSAEYAVVSYTSATVIVVGGNASGEASGDTFTMAADGDYRLPDDFGGIDGDLTFAPNKGWAPVVITGEGRIRAFRQKQTGGSRPREAAVVPLTSDGSAGQRFDLSVHPTPNAVYVLAYRKIALQNKLTAANPYPLGGAQHSHLFMASCLAAAESRFRRARGTRWGEFMDKLRTSITQDRRSGASEYLGPDLGGEHGVGMGNSFRVYHEKQFS